MFGINKRKKIEIQNKDDVELFRHEAPTIERKKDAIKYIKEFYKYKSNVNGAGGLDRYLNDYKGWLKHLEMRRNTIPNEESVPSETYFLVRCNDNKIVGMINIRLALNEALRNGAGHIGYSIRPTERRKGYNKINLYLALKRCDECGIEEVLMDCDKENPASARTMLALGGVLIKERENKEANRIEQVFTIDVKKSLRENAKKYETMLK